MPSYRLSTPVLTLDVAAVRKSRLRPERAGTGARTLQRIPREAGRWLSMDCAFLPRVLYCFIPDFSCQIYCEELCFADYFPQCSFSSLSSPLFQSLEHFTI
jgi:hypothetical protein